MSNDLAEIGRQWDRKIVPVLQQQSMGRKLVPKNMELSGKGIGNTSVQNYGYKDTASAITDFNIRHDIADTIDVGGQKILIPIQQDMITIPRRTFEEMKLGGYAVDSDMAMQMAAKLSSELDTTLIDGWKPDGTNYKVKGFYQAAGNSTAGSDFGTYGNAIKSVAAAIELFDTDKIRSDAGFNLVLAGTQYYQLLSSESSSGIAELPKVIDMLNLNTGGRAGTVMMSPDLAAGTGFMSPTATPGNIIYFDLIEALQPTNYLTYTNADPTNGDIILRQQGAATIRFKHMDSSSLTDPAVCKFTAI